MKVSVFMNRMAGNADPSAIREGIRRALFRCQVDFRHPASIEQLQDEIQTAIVSGVDAIILCGGDGTINPALGPLVSAQRSGIRLPRFSAIPVGTANDLAMASGISRRIDRAARAILEGEIKTIDVLEVSDGSDRCAWMVTNGGIGLAAFTAENVNRFKTWLRSGSTSPSELGALVSPIGFGLASSLVRRLGSRVYEVGVARELLLWRSQEWRVRVAADGHEAFETTSPLIQVSNQPKIGGNFTTAPFTRNDDGVFNLLVVEPSDTVSLVSAIVGMRRGILPSSPEVVQVETSEVVFEALHESRGLTFFGDGEILLKDSRRIRVRCVHPGVPFVGMEGGDP